MSPLGIVVLLLVLVILAFVSGKVPFSVIGIAVPVVLVATKVCTAADAFSGYTNTVIILITAMFVVGKGIMKTGIVEVVSNFVSKNSTNTRSVLLVMMIAATILSVIGSASSSVAVLLPLIFIAAEATKTSRSKYLLPIAIVANITTAVTFLGQGAYSMQWNEIMMNLGGTIPLTYMDFFMARLPFMIVAFIYCLFICPKLCPDIPNSEFDDNASSGKKVEEIPANIKKRAIVISVVTIVAMIVLDYLGIMKMYLVAIIGAIAFVVFGVLKEKEALQSINWSAMLMAGGLLGLANAMGTTGAADYVGSKLSVLLGGTTNPFILSLVFFLVPFALTQVMNNTACISVFTPLLASVAISIGADPRAAVLCVSCAGGAAFLTPMASTLMAIVAPEGKYDIKTMLKAGLPLAIVMVIIAAIYIPLMFPMY